MDSDLDIVRWRYNCLHTRLPTVISFTMSASMSSDVDELLPRQVLCSDMSLGPNVSERDIELMTPLWWPYDVLNNPTIHHLGYVRFTAIVSNDVDGPDHCLGSLYKYFTGGEQALATNETSAPFSPNNFLAAKFVRDLQKKLQLGEDDNFRMWLILSPKLPAYRIVSATQFRFAMAKFFLFFLESPTSRYRVYFVVEKDETTGLSQVGPDSIRTPPRKRWKKVVFLINDTDAATRPQEDQSKADDDQSYDNDGASEMSFIAAPFWNVPSSQPENHILSPESPQESIPCQTISVRTTKPAEDDRQSSKVRLRTPSPIASLGSPMLQTAGSSFERANSESVWTDIRIDDSNKSSQEPPVKNSSDVNSNKNTQGILSSFDTGARKGGFLLGDLQSLLPLSCSPTEQEWEDCCALLNLAPADHKDPRVRSVSIPGSEIRVSPRQYWAAYRMLICRQERDIAGGLVADAPGTGKSHTCIVFCLLRALVFQNVGEVKAEWAIREHETGRSAHSQPVKTARPKNHLPSTATGKEICPCKNKAGIQCYATPRSITRKIADSLVRGPSLIIAPPGITESWAEILLDARLDQRRYQPCFFRATASTDKFADLNPPADLKQTLAVTASPTSSSYAPEHVVSVQDGNFKYEPSKFLHRHPERIIMLAAYNSIKFKASFQVSMNFPFQKVNGTARQSRTVYGCPVGVQIVDECHLARSGNGAWATDLAKEHKHIRKGKFDFWSVTATPMPEAIGDISPLIVLLYRPEWDQPSHPHFPKRPAALKELSEAYQKAVVPTASSQDQLHFNNLAQRVLTRDLIVRHNEESTFFGLPIVNLQQVKPEKLTVLTPENYVHDLKMIADEVKADLVSTDLMSQEAMSKMAFQKSYKLQFLSSYPAAGKLMIENKMSFTKDSIREEILKWESRDVSQVPLFLGYAEEVIQDSPKLEKILNCIDQMENDQEERPANYSTSKRRIKKKNEKEPRDELQLKKMVIICPRLAEAVFLFLALKKLKGQLKPVLFHGDLYAAQRREIMNNFRSLKQGTSQIFIAPFDAAGTGLNLQVANWQILTGPLRHKDNEVQCFGRTNREGQELTLHHFLLLADDNPLDRLIITTQAKRKILSDPFDVETPLVVEPLGSEIEESSLP